MTNGSLPSPTPAQQQAPVTNKGVLVFVWGTLAAVVVALVISAFVLRPSGPPLPVLGQMTDFSLQDQDNHTVHLADFRGSVWIADVIFTRCAGQCPLMSTHLSAIANRLPADAPIRFVTFTTDPAYDSPPVMKKYAQRYNADTTRWTFLTGSKTDLHGAIVDGLKLAAMDKAVAQQENPADLFIHSAKFVLIDGHGRIRGYYDGETDASIDQVADAAKSLARNP